MIAKLTAANQLAAIAHDGDLVRGDKRPHYSIMQHIKLLAERVAALEAQAAKAIESDAP